MVGHIMHLASYLCTSRHGVFYFRYPVRSTGQRPETRRHIKLSLGTREPRIAAQLSRLLAASGQVVCGQPHVQDMRYDEMRAHVRAHFAQMLRTFRDRTDREGPTEGMPLETLRASEWLGEADPEDFAAIAHQEGKDGMLTAFCASRGIADVPEGRARDLLLSELQKGHREYAARALEHIADFENIALDNEPGAGPSTSPTVESMAPVAGDALPLTETVSRYFEEQQRTNALAAKTETDKRDALALMSELTGNKPLSQMTKADAQEIKAVLFKLPKSRRKNPKTRDLPLHEMLEVSGVERMSPRTMNVYLGHMQSLFTWGVNNGYRPEQLREAINHFDF